MTHCSSICLPIVPASAPALLAGAVRSGQVQGITHDGSEHNSPETEELRTVLVAVAAPEDVGRANPEDALQAALPVALVALGNVACLLKCAVLEEIATPYLEERRLTLKKNHGLKMMREAHAHCSPQHWPGHPTGPVLRTAIRWAST